MNPFECSSSWYSNIIVKSHSSKAIKRYKIKIIIALVSHGSDHVDLRNASHDASYGPIDSDWDGRDDSRQLRIVQCNVATR